MKRVKFYVAIESGTYPQNYTKISYQLNMSVSFSCSHYSNSLGKLRKMFLIRVCRIFRSAQPMTMHRWTTFKF